MDLYRAHLLEAISILQQFGSEFFDSIINVGMHGEFADINDIFEPGDEHIFELEHFDNSRDVNLQELVNFQKTIEALTDRLININAVKEAEIYID